MATSTKSNLVGVVLAGGLSKRMGRDKSLIDYHGMPQREYAFQLLNNFCESVFLSCRNASGIPTHFNAVEDQLDFQSPLNGILSVWSLVSESALLTLPVDMPWVGREEVQELVALRDPGKMATCFYDSERSRPEPLLCIWEPRGYKLLLSFAQAGQISPRQFLEAHDVRLIQASRPDKLKSVDAPQDMLNRPE